MSNTEYQKSYDEFHSIMWDFNYSPFGETYTIPYDIDRERERMGNKIANNRGHVPQVDTSNIDW